MIINYTLLSEPHTLPQCLRTVHTEKIQNTSELLKNYLISKESQKNLKGISKESQCSAPGEGSSSEREWPGDSTPHPRAQEEGCRGSATAGGRGPCGPAGVLTATATATPKLPRGREETNSPSRETDASEPTRSHTSENGGAGPHGHGRAHGTWFTAPTSAGGCTRGQL